MDGTLACKRTSQRIPLHPSVYSSPHMCSRLAILLCALAAIGFGGGDGAPPPKASSAGIVLPCGAYAEAPRSGGNFGRFVDAKRSPFHGTWHLAEDVRLVLDSAAPKAPPADIMSWCEGYGAKATLEEWLHSSKFIATHAPKR